MGANKNLYGTIQQTIEYLLTAFALHDTRQQSYTDIHIVKECHNGLQVLLGQYLGRSHDAGLIAVAQCDKHRHQGHEGLTASHIALKQTVHLPTTAHILSNLTNDTLLCFRQGERQVVVIEVVEVVAHLREYVTAIFTSLVAGIPEDVQLDVKQFLELQTRAGTLQFLGILRIMNLT